MTMHTSFVIPHKGREELLIRTLRAIGALDHPDGDIQILVVTQNERLEAIPPLPVGVHLEVLPRPARETIAALRNAGARRATGEFLAFLDADIEVPRAWLTTMLAELTVLPRRVLVSAVQHHPPGAHPIERIRGVLSRRVADQPVAFLGGANLLMRRATFDAVGGFPEALATCEDYYFTDRVNQIGEVYCTSRSGFVHLGEDRTYGELFRKEIWRGQANLRSVSGRRLLPSELPSLLTPVWQAGWALVMVLLFALGAWVWALASVAMLALPVVLYTGRLYRSARGIVGLASCGWFYAVYQAARVVGTFRGAVALVQASPGRS